MVVKKVLFVLLAILSIGKALAIDQIGIAYRYNGKKQRTPLGGVYIKVATSPNGVVSQELNGQFVLKLKGIKMGDAMGTAIVQKAGMMVFNKDEVNRWSVQRKPLVLIICDADEFQKQKERLIAIGRNQAEKKYKQKIELLKAQNAKQQLSLDQYYAKLDLIEKEKNNALAHMDEYADMFARIDESEIDTLAQRAVELFNQGQLEEAIKLFEQGNYLEKLDDALKVKKQAEDMRQKADTAETLANKDIEEYTKTIQAQVTAYKMSNEWDNARDLLKGMADKLQTLDAIWDYAKFAQNQNMFIEAEKEYKLYIKKILSNTNPQVYETNLAKSYNNLANLYSDTQRFNEAEQMYKAVLEIRKRLAYANPQAYEPDLAACYNNLARLYYKIKQFDESEQMYKIALIKYKCLVNENPLVYEFYLAQTYSNIASLFFQTYRLKEAEQMVDVALEINKRLVEKAPQTYEQYLAQNYNSLASIYCSTRRLKESEQICNLALRITKRLADINPQAYESDLAYSYHNLAYVYSVTKRFNEAEQMYKSALEIRKRLTDADPQAYEQDLAQSYYSLANLYSDTQRFNEAEQMYKSALEIRKRLTDANPQAYGQDLAQSYYSLANLYSDTQQFNRAEQMYKAALEIVERFVDTKQQFYAACLFLLADSRIEQKKYSEAITPLEKSLDYYKKEAENGISTDYYYKAISWLYQLYSQEKSFKEAEQMYKAALEVYKHLVNANPKEYEPYLAAIYNDLANLYSDTQRYNEAEQMYKATLEIGKRLVKANTHRYSKEQAECLFWLADSRIKQEKYSEAIAPLETALDFYKKEAENGISTNFYYDAISWLHQLYSQEKKYLQAYQCFKLNIPTLRALYKSDKSNYAELMNDILVSQSFYSIFEKQYAEAEAYSKEALEVDSTKHFSYGNLAPALLFQGKYQEAEKIYRLYKSELKEGFLSDFDEFTKAGVIPKNREEDVEKIKKILEED